MEITDDGTEDEECKSEATLTPKPTTTPREPNYNNMVLDESRTMWV